MAIGISFVFLLFSLVVSAANELVQAILAMRVRELKAGIGELLQDRKFQHVAKASCNHPLISCLSKEAAGLKRAVNAVFLAEQPGYLAPGPSGQVRGGSWLFIEQFGLGALADEKVNRLASAAGSRRSTTRSCR